jgi:glycosyltransferase involved in cell wall biosynthesis
MLSYGLPTPGRQRGGVDRVAHDIAEGLSRRGLRVIIWSYDPPPPGARYELRRLRGDRIAHSWLGRRLLMGYAGNLLPLHPDMWRDLRQCDIFIAHGDSVLLPLLGRPVIRIFHGSALEEALHSVSYLRRVAQAGVYAQELVTALGPCISVAVSENSRRYNPWIGRVIPNGIDLTRFRPEPEAKTLHPSLLFVGALGGRKRGRELLDWFARVVRRRFPTATLEMVSEPGPELPGVTYHSGLAEPALVQLYQSSWILASPSTYEGFGIPYLEAMATGTPIVATPNQGSLEILGDGPWGRLVSDDTFAQELVSLLDDQEGRAELSRRGQERVRDFDLERTVDRYVSLINETLGTN